MDYLCLYFSPESLVLPERLLGDMRTGEMEGVRDEEYGLCRSLSIVEDEATKWYCDHPSCNIKHCDSSQRKHHAVPHFMYRVFSSNVFTMYIQVGYYLFPATGWQIFLAVQDKTCLLCWHTRRKIKMQKVLWNNTFEKASNYESTEQLFSLLV